MIRRWPGVFLAVLIVAQTMPVQATQEVSEACASDPSISQVGSVTLNDQREVVITGFAPGSSVRAAFARRGGPTVNRDTTVDEECAASIQLLTTGSSGSWNVTVQGVA